MWTDAGRKVKVLTAQNSGQSNFRVSRAQNASRHCGTHREPQRDVGVLLDKLHELLGIAGVIQKCAAVLDVHTLHMPNKLMTAELYHMRTTDMSHALAPVNNMCFPGCRKIQI